MTKICNNTIRDDEKSKSLFLRHFWQKLVLSIIKLKMYIRD